MPQPVTKVEFLGFTGGVNKSAPRDQMRPSQSPDMENFTVIDGIATKRTGMLADTGSLPNVRTGAFLGGSQYAEPVSGLERMWIATQGKVYQKASALFSANWSEVTTANLLQVGLEQYGVFAQNVAAADLKNYIFLCQNHTNYLTALNGTSPGHANEMVIQYANSPTGNMSALTGALGYNAADQSDDANFHRAKYVMTLGGSLVLLNTFEKTAASTWLALPYRIRISNENAFLASGDWETTGTSIATVRDARFGMGSIVGAALVRSGLAVWLERGIAMLLQTDASFAPFTLQMRVPGLGLYSPKLIQTVRGRAYFVGTDKQIYMYWGGPDPEPIGQKIQPFFFDNINKGTSAGYLIRRRSTSLHLQDIQAIAFIIPETGKSSAYTWWVYFYLTGKWDRWTMKSTATAAPSTTAGAEWSQAAGIAADNLPLIGDHEGNVYHWDYSNVSDAGIAISAYITTATVDLGAKNRNQSTHLWFESTGDGAASSVAVSASDDNGATFGTPISKTIRTDWSGAYKVPITIQGTKLSWKFANSSATQKLKLGRVWVGLASQGEVD